MGWWDGLGWSPYFTMALYKPVLFVFNGLYHNAAIYKWIIVVITHTPSLPACYL